MDDINALIGLSLLLLLSICTSRKAIWKIKTAGCTFPELERKKCTLERKKCTRRLSYSVQTISSEQKGRMCRCHWVSILVWVLLSRSEGKIYFNKQIGATSFPGTFPWGCFAVLYFPEIYVATLALPILHFARLLLPALPLFPAADFEITNLTFSPLNSNAFTIAVQFNLSRKPIADWCVHNNYT